MIAVRKYELVSGKTLIKQELKDKSDNLIYSIWVAVIKNLAKIWKLILKQISKLPRISAHFLHFSWSKLRDKVDRFFEKMHRNPKIF
jgi:hypothetical protein